MSSELSLPEQLAAAQAQIQHLADQLAAEREAAQQAQAQWQEQFDQQQQQIAHLTAQVDQAAATIRHQAEQANLLQSLTQQIRQTLDVRVVLETAVDRVREFAGVDRAVVYRFLPDWSGAFVAESVGEPWVRLMSPEMQPVWADTCLQEHHGSRFQNHELLAVPDIYQAGFQPCHVEVLERIQAKALVVAPIFAGDALWGLLAMYQNTATRTWQEEELAVLQQVAEQVGIALHQASLYEQAQADLQQRQRAEAAMQRQLGAIEAAVDGIALLQEERFLYLNAAHVRLFGYESATELLGQSWRRLHSPEVIAQFDQVILPQLRQAKSWQGDVWAMRRDGTPFLVFLSLTLLDDGIMVAVCRDITEEKQAEQALQDQQRFIEQAIQTNPDLLVCLFDVPSQSSHFISESVASMVGYTVEEILGMGTDLVPRLVHPEDQPRFAAYLHQIDHSPPDASPTLDYRVRHRDGRWLWQRLQGQAYSRDAEGRLQQVLGSILNITAQKTTEISLDDAETLYRTLFEALDEGVCLFEPLPQRPDGLRDYRYVAMNPAMQAMFSIPDLSGQSIRDHFPEEAEAWYNDYDRVLETGVSLRFERESIPQGKVFEVFLTRVEDSAGYRLLAVIQDVTDCKRTERNLAFLADLATDLSRLYTPEAIMATVGAKLGDYLQVKSCLFTTVDDAADQATVPYTWHTADTPDLAGVYQMSAFITDELRQIARAGGTMVINDTQDIPHVDRDRYAALQVRAHVSVPCHREGIWKYLLVVTDAVPRRWRADEIDLIQEVTNRVFPRLERAEAEAAVQDLSERLALALQAGSIGTWDWDGVNEVNWDDQMYILYGQQGHQNQAIYLTWRDSLHPDDLDRVEALIRAAWRGEADYDVEFRILRPSGELRWIYAVAQVQRDHQGNPIRMVGINQDITERKQAETELQSLARRLSLALQAGHIGFWLWDLNQEIFWDASLCRIYGLSAADQVTDWQTWHNRVHPEDVERVEALLHAALQGAPYEGTEFRIYRTDGELRWIQSSAYVQRDDQGHPIHMIGINQDITARKQAELTLKEQTSRLTLALKAGAYGIWEWDLVSDPIWDDQLYYDYGLQDLGRLVTYQDWQRAVHPDDIQWVEAQMEADLRARIPFSAEYRIRRPNGELRWVLDMAKLYCDGQGQPLRMVGIHQDITNRKLAEQEIRNSRAKFQRLVDDIGDRFVIFSHTGTIMTYVSAGVQSVFGLPPETILGKSWATAVNWLPETLELAEAKVQKLLTERVPSQEFEMSFIRPDGAIRTIHVVQHPVWDEANNLLAVEGLVEDITERKATEAALRRTNAELERATHLKDEFLANMSHELRTPLNAILGMTEGLQEEIFGAVTERQQRSLETIQRSSSHLLALINDILDLSKIEAGQLELDFASIRPGLLCSGSVAFVKQQAHKKRQQITMLLPEGLPDLYGDDRRLRQVLINLLTNAVKFTPEGGQITLAASYTARTAAPLARSETWIHPHANSDDTLGLLSLSVTDTGIGIRPDDARYLFQPFVQVNTALNRQHEGTGLGLSLVKRIVEAHGGEVTLSSEEGQGSCFTVHLPVIPIPGAVENASAALGSIAAADPATSGTAPLILLAEDNEANISTTSAYLEAKGYQIIVARNGLDAVTLATTAQPDLILMDIQMPHLDGLAAIHQLRQTPTLATVPIIALTALAMPTDQERCLAAGANAYLSKPIRLKQLAQHVAVLLAPGG